MRLLDLILGRRSARDAASAERGKKLAPFLEEAASAPPEAKPSDLETGRTLLETDRQEQIETLHACLEVLADDGSIGGRSFNDPSVWSVERQVLALTRALLRRRLPYGSEDLCALVRMAGHRRTPSESLIGAIERALGDSPPDGDLRSSLEQYRHRVSLSASGAETTRHLSRVDRLLDGPSKVAVEPVDAWTIRLRQALDSLDDDSRRSWHRLLDHALTATSTKPSKKWLGRAEELLAEMDRDGFVELLVQLLGGVGTPAPFPVKIGSPSGPGGTVDGDPRLVSGRFSDALRGLIWASSPIATDELLPAIGNAAERCFQKIPDHGPLATKVGNACLVVLSRNGSREAIGQLTRLGSRVRHPSTRKQIAKALEEAALGAGLSRAALEERAVPTYGLTEVGLRTEAFGDYRARLELIAANKTRLSWVRPDGTSQKTVPAVVKAEHPDQLEAMRRSASEIKKVLPGHRHRIERMLLKRRELPFPDWREHYLDHPLAGFLARRLIWQLTGDGGQLMAFSEGRLVDVGGREVTPDDTARVRLWHPIDSSAQTVQSWRQWLRSREVTQPFKQAHREVYLLTDAERRTGTYSNRFAAHLVKQHQLRALLAERGWEYSLQGQWDSFNTPFISLPDLGWRVEFWVEPVGEEEVTDTGVYLYLSTDQVRFHSEQEPEPTRLDEVPAIVFSEMLRDVDLFVSVSSVGNDPAWLDAGERGPLEQDYWREYAFGELSETAASRRETLATILPKLKIAARCSLEDRFLLVRGDLHSYRIHLGSGNVLMTHNDQYLCIVAQRRAHAAPAYGVLPFEGDTMLSVILSKALMLAEDRRIKDPTIVSQIRGT